MDVSIPSSLTLLPEYTFDLAHRFSASCYLRYAIAEAVRERESEESNCNIG